MNNAKIVQNNTEKGVDISERLEQYSGELSQVVEAINRVEQSEDWRKLKKLLLDGVVDKLERDLANEAKKAEIDAPNLYRLQGQLAWARKYADLKKLSEFFRKQIESIKLKLHEKQTEDGAS